MKSDISSVIGWSVISQNYDLRSRKGTDRNEKGVGGVDPFFSLQSLQSSNPICQAFEVNLKPVIFADRGKLSLLMWSYGHNPRLSYL